jgi:hypothetical protein
MRHFVIPFFALATLASCGGGNDTGKPDQSAPILTVGVFKSSESLQCTGGGLSLATMEGQLSAAGVTVSAKSCGNDGRVYAAVCGAPDGRIGIFDIPQAKLQEAAAAGFAPLSSLPGAARTGC